MKKVNRLGVFFGMTCQQKVSLSIKTWKTNQQSYEDASSILDSLTNTAEVKGEAGFCGIGSVEAKAGVKGGESRCKL